MTGHDAAYSQEYPISGIQEMGIEALTSNRDCILSSTGAEIAVVHSYPIPFEEREPYRALKLVHPLVEHGARWVVDL